MPIIKYTKKRSKSKSISKNEKILEVLDIFLQFYTAKKDKIHILAYSKAIHGLKSAGREIKSLSDAMDIPGIGKGMLEKINIIIRTGNHPNVNEMLAYIGASSNELTKLMGFGSSLVALLKTRYGITTLQELDAYLAIQPIPEMSHIAVLGWKYRTDLATPIPRAETTAFFTKLSAAVLKDTALIKIAGGEIKIQLAGSYPSGKLFSKDIDILAFYPTSSIGNSTEIMESLVKVLQTVSGDMEIVLQGKTKFIGLVKTGEQGIYRHIDIALYPIEVQPYAILYFTSGKVVNQIMREKAKKLGYKLNEFGLFDRKTGKKINIKEPVIENIKQLLKID